MTPVDIEPNILNSVVVIERRGYEPVEWSTDDGLVNLSMVPFGVMGQFEGKAMQMEMISWYEVSSLSISKLEEDTPADQPVRIMRCPKCGGRGLTEDGEERCDRCEGWGHVSDTG